ncbi:hypothetical protein L596_028289 [Steinernema carpocapsae]|uniref:Uncharacterized protein n=1 Tax=Steinernema carpocapsae TaxID=34508 RepID=A0A4U5LY03_STECR|nr:hypothetical protein L596_028289 [Steinernema carpocapsae]
MGVGKLLGQQKDRSGEISAAPLEGSSPITNDFSSPAPIDSSPFSPSPIDASTNYYDVLSEVSSLDPSFPPVSDFFHSCV